MKQLLGPGKLSRTVTDILLAIIGSALVALSLSVFTIPNNIAPGGVSGLSTALAHVTPIRVSVWSLMLNVPLMLGAWRILGPRSLIMTLLSTLLLSLFIDLTALWLPGYTNNALLAAVFGGALGGLGVGILFLRGISTGGTDLLALLLRRFLPNVPSGTLLLFIDAAVVAVAVCIFRDIEVALYSAIALVISSKVIDALAEGVDYAKVIYIVTERGDDILALLADELGRGVTVLQGRGGYTRRDKHMLVLVVRRNSFSQTPKTVKQIDKEAFIFVTDATEVHGEGFKPME